MSSKQLCFTREFSGWAGEGNPEIAIDGVLAVPNNMEKCHTVVTYGVCVVFVFLPVWDVNCLFPKQATLPARGKGGHA